MKRLLPCAALSFITTLALAATPATQPASIPPSAATADQVLKSSPRHGEWVDIDLPNSQTKLHTWIVYPERSDKAPVVLVIHEIFGMSDWVRAVADQLAAEGFIAVAPDLISGMGPNNGNTDSMGDNVGDYIRKLTPAEQVARLNAARDYALKLPAASNKFASIGFCWGGGTSFFYATQQPQLNAAVVFYGTPPTNDNLAKITCPIFGFYGKDDGRITLTVPDTQKTMADLHKSYTPHIYDGAGHGFLRQQDARNGANQKAADTAWPLTIQFLKQTLEQK